MTAPLTPQHLGAAFATAKTQLENAQLGYTDAVLRLAEAKALYDDRRMALLREGVEGKNAEQREAVMHEHLTLPRQVLYEAEGAMTEAKHALEGARLEWDLCHYRLRLLELGKVSA